MSKMNRKLTYQSPSIKEYGIAPISPMSNHKKMFQRKQQPMMRERILSNHRKRTHQEISKGQLLKASCDLHEMNRVIRSKSNANLNNDTIKKAEKETKLSKVMLPQTKSKSPQQASQPKASNKVQSENKFLKDLRQKEEDCSQEILKKLKKQINQLRNENLSLNRQLYTLRQQNDSHRHSYEALNQRMKYMNEAGKETKQKIDEKNKQIKKLTKSIQQQRATIKKLQQSLQNKENQLEILSTEKKEKDQLQRALSEMNKNFDDMFVESKGSEFDSGVNSNFQVDFQPSSYEQIIALQERIKYQDIEINMLKKFRFQMQRYKSEMEKQKLQNKILINKIKHMPIKDKKLKPTAFEESQISFQLSRDENI